MYSIKGLLLLNNICTIIYSTTSINYQDSGFELSLRTSQNAKWFLGFATQKYFFDKKCEARKKKENKRLI